MSKPSDINQEAWDEAWGVEAWARPHYAVDTSEADKNKVVEIIARAIMAAVTEEREAIIELVNDMANGEGTDFGLIAAIRNRSKREADKP